MKTLICFFFGTFPSVLSMVTNWRFTIGNSSIHLGRRPLRRRVYCSDMPTHNKGRLGLGNSWNHLSWLHWPRDQGPLLRNIAGICQLGQISYMFQPFDLLPPLQPPLSLPLCDSQLPDYPIPLFLCSFTWAATLPPWPLPYWSPIKTSCWHTLLRKTKDTLNG